MRVRRGLRSAKREKKIDDIPLQSVQTFSGGIVPQVALVVTVGMDKEKLMCEKGNCHKVGLA